MKCFVIVRRQMDFRKTTSEFEDMKMMNVDMDCTFGGWLLA